MTLAPADAPPDETAPAGRDRLAWVPAVLLALPMVAAFAWLTWTRGDMNDWAVSRMRLAAGEYALIGLHMLAHGGIIHLLLNGGTLIALGPAVMDRLGPLSPRTLAGFTALFAGSGIAGLALWLALPHAAPMLGASGAIFGLLGFILRQPDPHQPPIALVGAGMGRAFIVLGKLHLPLIAIFAIPMLLGVGGFGLAWEAHLGGFVAGLLLHGPAVRLAGYYAADGTSRSTPGVPPPP